MIAGRRWLASLAGGLLLLLAATLRWRVAGWRRAGSLLAAGEPVVFAFWHGSAPLVLLCRSLPRTTVLVSKSQDGDLAAGLLRRLDQDIVRGSTSGGGATALRKLLPLVHQGRRPAIAVDGPRGPRGRPGPGAAHLARRSGAWVVPVAATTRRGLRLRSWDRAVLPWPGSRSALTIGRPLRWVEAPSEERFAAALADRLERAQRRAARLCGRSS